MNSQQLRSSGEFSDLTIQVGDQLLRLHRFPLLSRSEYFRGLLRSGMADTAHVTLTGLPGGFRTMEMVADFCYGVDITGTFSTSNVGHLLCAASYLQMSGKDNLTELCHCKLTTFIDTSALHCLEILVHCADVAPEAEQEGIVKQCVEGLVDYLELDSLVKSRSEDLLARLETWMPDIRDLPFRWVISLLEDLQSRDDSIKAIVIKLSAGYIDYILKCHSQASLHSLPEMKKMQPDRPPQCESIADPTERQLLMKAIDTQETELGLEDESDQSEEDENADTRTESNDLTELQSVSFEFPLQFQWLSAADPTLLLQVLETVLSYLPDDAPQWDVVNVGWFVSIFHFAYQHCLHSVNRLTALCASVYNHLVLQDVQNLSPSSFSELNNSVRIKYHHWNERVAELTDSYLKLHASTQSINASDFASLLETTAWCHRTSYERAFEALELLIANSSGVVTLLQEDIIEITNQMNMTMLSQDALERAACNHHIPCKITMEAAVSVSHRLRQDLRELEGEAAKLRSCADLLKQTEAKLETALCEAQEKQERVNYLQRIRESMKLQLVEADLAPEKELAGIWKLESSQSHFDETETTYTTRSRTNFMAERNGATLLTIQPRGRDVVSVDDREERRPASKRHYFEFEMSQARTQRCITRSQSELSGHGLDANSEHQSSDRTKRREDENYQQMGSSHIRAKRGYFFHLCDLQATCNTGTEVVGAKRGSSKSSDTFPPFLVYDPDTCSLYTPVHGRRLEFKSWTKL